MKRLYVSDEAIKKYGYEYFRNDEYDDFILLATWGVHVKLADRLLLTCDDDEDLYLQVSLDDCSLFNDVDILYNNERSDLND